MTQCVKALAEQARGLEFKPWSPHTGRRREQTPLSCPIASMCIHICIHRCNNTYNLVKNWLPIIKCSLDHCHVFFSSISFCTYPNSFLIALIKQSKNQCKRERVYFASKINAREKGFILACGSRGYSSSL